jgi:8-oxo-dGTP diphosphatase
MVIYFVRHAKAGSRDAWRGDDRLRPLSKSGHRQAKAIAEQLSRVTTTKLLSSPYVRCVQTLEALAARTGATVKTREELAEGASFEPVLELLATLPDNSVLCSHGDVIPDTIAALQRRGCRIVGTADWRKGTVWVLERSDDPRLIVSRATVWPPPD